MAGAGRQPPEDRRERQQRPDDDVAGQHVEQQLLVGPPGPVGAPGQVGAGGLAEQLPEVGLDPVELVVDSLPVPGLVLCYESASRQPGDLPGCAAALLRTIQSCSRRYRRRDHAHRPGRCQQGTRTVSAAFAGLWLQPTYGIVPGTIPLPTMVHGLRRPSRRQAIRFVRRAATEADRAGRMREPPSPLNRVLVRSYAGCRNRPGNG